MINSDILNVLSRTCIQDIPKPLKIKQGVNKGMYYKHINEKQVCDVLERIWFNGGLKVAREAQLLLPERANKRKLDNWRYYWLNGAVYSLIRADFLFDTVAIEVKCTNKTVVLNEGFTQCKFYLGVPGISSSLLIAYNYDTLSFCVWAFQRNKYPQIKDAIIILVKEQRPWTQEQEKQWVRERITPVIEYGKRKVAERLKKMNKEYSVAGYV